jgi:hypothetical protein
VTGEMQVHEVTVDRRLSRGTHPGRDYRGRCYELGFKYMTGHQAVEPALRLVHGTLFIRGDVPYPHAWVEIPGGIVFDPVDQRFFTRKGYYQVLHAKAEAHYTMAEAGQRAITTNHYGPWHAQRRYRRRKGL